MENCVDCRFQHHGSCRRRAPVPGLVPMKAYWPTVEPYEQWCGEFEPQPFPPPPPPPKEYDVKPTKGEPCAECQSPDGKTFFAVRSYSTCERCGATDEIPF